MLSTVALLGSSPPYILPMQLLHVISLPLLVTSRSKCNYPQHQACQHPSAILAVVCIMPNLALLLQVASQPTWGHLGAPAQRQQLERQQKPGQKQPSQLGPHSPAAQLQRNRMLQSLCIQVNMTLHVMSLVNINHQSSNQL